MMGDFITRKVEGPVDVQVHNGWMQPCGDT